MLVLDAINSGTYSMYHHLHLKSLQAARPDLPIRLIYQKLIPKAKQYQFFLWIVSEGTKKKLFLIEWVAWVMVKGVLGSPLQDHPIPAMKSQ